MRLIIKSDLDVILDLESKDGKLIEHFVKEDLVPAVERWKLQGISEWITKGEGPDRDTYPRITSASDEKFLSRLRDYLNRQFNTFNYYLDERS
jgi:hypothetical protein